jgi:hypothetical protein
LDQDVLGLKVAEEHKPYQIAYTGISSIDELLCMLVTIFHAAMAPGVPYELTAYFVGTCLPVMTFLYPIEAYRKESSFLIKFPTVYGLVYQLMSIGVTNPIWCFLFVATGAASSFKARSHITQAHAEAIVFGVIVGVFIPTLGMFALFDKYATATWQAFPLISMIARELYLLVRTPKKVDGDGFRLIQISLIGYSVIASFLHMVMIYPKFKHPEELVTLLIPSAKPLGEHSSLEASTLNLLQWDFIFGIGTSVLLILCFAQTAKQFAALFLYIAVAVPLVGPGATIAGAYLWRESHLKSLPSKTRA